jgi:predicted aconitase with swiveling domain
VKEFALKCRSVTEGKAKGPALVTSQPISFWGGVDPKTGLIVEKSQELRGKNVTGKVLVFPYGRGSSTSSAVFLEAVRCEKAPVAIVNVQTEPLLAIGAILAKQLYGKSIPIVDHVEENPCRKISNDDMVEVDAERGIIKVRRRNQKG